MFRLLCIYHAYIGQGRFTSVLASVVVRAFHLVVMMIVITSEIGEERQPSQPYTSLPGFSLPYTIHHIQRPPKSVSPRIRGIVLHTASNAH